MINVQIKNIAQIREAFLLAPTLMVKELDKAIKLVIINGQRETLLNVSGARGIRKVSGGLYHSVASGASFGRLSGSLYANIEYASYVHEGTYKMKARPFMADAFNKQDKQTQEYFTNAVDNVLKSIAGRV